MLADKLMVNTGRLVDPGDFPKVVLLDTTSFCNLRCSMCGHQTMMRRKGNMSTGLYWKLIDEIAVKNSNARVWMVFFGEALILRNKLIDRIQYAKSKGLTDVVLNSNGNLLDEEIATALVKSGLDAIYVGIDASSKKTYDKIRVGGNFDKVVANVNGLIDTKHKMHANTPDVYVQFVEMDENQHEVDPFTEYWSEHGAMVKIRPKVTWAGTVDPYKVSSVQRFPCYWAMQTVNICWDGRVVLCSVDYDARYVAGDASKDTIQSVWLGKLKRMRDAHLSGRYDLLPLFCQECTDWQMAKAAYH